VGKPFLQARRLGLLPPYPFAELDRIKKQAVAAGRPIIDFGIGDPDEPTPLPVISAMAREMRDPATHRYPIGSGSAVFRNAVAAWYRKRFGVSLNPAGEVCALIGSKEGIAHFPWAFVNPGETVLVPDPGYPVYRATTILCGGHPESMPLTRENAFLPDLEAVGRKLRRGARVKLMFINYPNNPTGATAPREFYRRVVSLAARYGFIVAHDAAYSEIFFDGADRPASFLSVPGAKEVGIEFHSVSKTCNMTGWRIGFAVGNPALVGGLARLKENIDSGAFEAIQRAAVTGLKRSQEFSGRTCRTLLERRDLLVTGLRTLGLPAPRPRATFYVWTPLPPGVKSADFARWLMEKADIVATAGLGFGKYGEGYIRFSLTVGTKKIREACRRLEKLAGR
jgi:LL-diaminopimelate aminotransferase